MRATPLPGREFREDSADPPPQVEQGAISRHQAQLALDATPQVVAALVKEPVENLGTLRQLCGWQPTYFSRAGVVDQWATALQNDPANLLPEQSLPIPRLIISGAFAAWTQVSAIGDDREAERARENLTENLLSIIPRCAEEGVRAAEQQNKQDAKTFADSLTT